MHFCLGPAESLWNVSYYQLMKESLRENGIICCQGEDNWYYSKLIADIVKFAGNIFPSVSYSLGKVPSYPAGTCGYILCCLEDVSKK